MSLGQAEGAAVAKMDRPLTGAEQGEVENGVAGAIQWLGGVRPALPDEWQERLYEAINAFRSEPVDSRKALLSKAALCFGCLWGQTICYELGWEWAAVSLEPGAEFYGVVSPSRSHMVFPLHYLQDLLSDPERDQTSLLLYNMLKAGSLPPASPGEYSVIG
jgi:hypothetical protein